jgi:hypothetical protein
MQLSVTATKVVASLTLRPGHGGRSPRFAVRYRRPGMTGKEVTQLTRDVPEPDATR